MCSTVRNVKAIELHECNRIPGPHSYDGVCCMCAVHAMHLLILNEPLHLKSFLNLLIHSHCVITIDHFKGFVLTENGQNGKLPSTIRTRVW